MKIRVFSLFFLITVLGVFPLFSQTKEAGPIIPDHGKVWKIENADLKVDIEKEYKVVFDIMDSPKDTDALNAKIETAARFLNMHAQAGVPSSNLKAVLVVHNAASKDIITSEAYHSRFGSDNPNEDLVRDLLEADVQVIFCGQSSVSRGFPKEDLIPGVQLSLSAMTALIELQGKGYQLIKF